MDISKIKFDEKGLVPAIVQDRVTGAVLMLAYMNEESINLTNDTGYAHYYSRSRQCMWKKGETSGHLQKVISAKYDCDGDTILLIVEQNGVACHTGEYTCFHNTFIGEDIKVSPQIMMTLYDIILDRRDNPKDGSYTNYLFNKGLNKTCKKVGEETAEVIIGAVSGDNENVVYEIADLLYHLSVLMAQCDITWDDVYGELARRK